MTFRSPPPHRKSSGNLGRGKGGKPNKYLPSKWKCQQGGWCSLRVCADAGICRHATAPPLRQCEAISEDTCRALYCPRHAKRLLYCPWEKNGHLHKSG